MTLFERFERGTGSRRKPDDDNLTSIIDNLNSVLNTRRGYGSFLPDFGMRDLSEYSTRNDIAAAVMAEVKQCITLYEPRVQLVNMTMKPDKNPLRLCFTLECTIRENSKSLHMLFDTMFSTYRIDNPRD